MKKIILIVFILCYNINIKAQPTSEMIDIMYGSTIEFNEILEKDSELVIDDWFVDKENNKYELYVLQKKADKHNPFSSFSIKQSEIDNTYKNLYFIYGDVLMTLKILKNKTGLKVKIKKLNFEKGTYILDLEELSKKSNEKEGVKVNEFPVDVR
jgi:hypothetical protein